MVVDPPPRLCRQAGRIRRQAPPRSRPRPGLVCIAFSIIAHSSTDVPIARAFDVDALIGIPDKDQPNAVPPKEDRLDART
ncbi:hypothetical protein ACF06V_34345 [Streptomyces bobili]|uniref:hypothetical protein n=1 Tax=Streptomyces bobili TaxID=67280 RepID=UPI0036F86D55